MMTKGKPRFNKVLNAAILEIVENQLRDGDPPETRETYERLRKSGYSDKEARNLIGCVVISEIVEILESQQPYNPERYIAALKRLPRVPWE